MKTGISWRCSFVYFLLMLHKQINCNMNSSISGVRYVRSIRSLLQMFNRDSWVFNACMTYWSKYKTFFNLQTLSFVCMLFMFWQLSLCWFLTCNYSIYCIILFCIKNFLINYAYIDQLFSLHSTNNINIFIDCKEIYSLLKLVSIWNMISDVIII